MSVKVKMTFDFKKGLPVELKKAVKQGLNMAGLAFERKAKQITTEEKHVRTGRYRASVNANSDDGINRSSVAESKGDDGIHEFIDEGGKQITLRLGSNVEYAVHLEKRYGIFARAKDASTDDMVKLFTVGMKKSLGW